MDETTEITATDVQTTAATPDSSAGVLAAGLSGLLLAGLCLVFGQYQAVTYDGFGSSGAGWLITGAVLGVIAAVVTIMGVYFLARAVDMLARAARTSS